MIMIGDRRLTFTLVWPLMGYPNFPNNYLVSRLCYPILRVEKESIKENERLIHTQYMSAHND